MKDVLAVVERYRYPERSEMTKRKPLTEDMGCISFWVGKFSSESDLEDFIDSGSFEKEQGFKIEPPFLPFHAFDDKATASKLLGRLMREPRLLDVALRVRPAVEFNSVIRYEDVRYDASAAPKTKRRRMVFLGTFKARDRK